MKLSELTSHETERHERLESDRGYADAASRLAVADAVAQAVIRYRAERGITQRALAEQLDWKQPQIARLERGDVRPTLETLDRLARAGVVEVHVGREGTQVTGPSARQRVA